MAKIELTRRRILGGLVTIGAGSAAAGAGTFALFSDTEEDSASLSAGTIDLQAGSTSGVEFSPGTPIAPTEDGGGTIDLTESTTGNFDSNLNIGVGDVVSNESEGTNDDGNLDEQLELRVWVDEGQTGSLENSDPVLSFDADGNPTTVDGETNEYYTANKFENTTWNDVTPSENFGVTVHVDWQFPNDENRSGIDDNNDAQGDDITVNFDFTLEQRN